MSVDMNAVRASVKSWERQFEAQNHRKPTSTDAKADSEVWRLYQQYRAHKKQSLRSPSKQSLRSPSKQPIRSPSKQSLRSQSKPSLSHRAQHSPSKRSTFRSPQKGRSSLRTPTKPKAGLISMDSDTEDDEDTPSRPVVTEVFPTPQLRGRALGLFDLELPSTPSKTRSAPTGSPSRRSPVKTPVNAAAMETPLSKKTPDYFLQRVNLFPTETGESPLIKLKKTRKSVSELVRESLFAANNEPAAPSTLRLQDSGDEPSQRAIELSQPTEKPLQRTEEGSQRRHELPQPITDRHNAFSNEPQRNKALNVPIGDQLETQSSESEAQPGEQIKARIDDKLESTKDKTGKSQANDPPEIRAADKEENLLHTQAEDTLEARSDDQLQAQLNESLSQPTTQPIQLFPQNDTPHASHSEHSDSEPFDSDPSDPQIHGPQLPDPQLSESEQSDSEPSLKLAYPAPLQPSSESAVPSTELDQSKEYIYDGRTNEMPLSVPEFDRRRKPKRQTKRVIMRPIGVEKEVSTAKPTNNFVRLKINKKKPMRRR